MASKQHVEELLGQLAPIEDEEIGLDEEHAVAESREWLKHNAPIPHEEVLAEFGLTITDFERMGRSSIPSDPIDF